MHGMKRAVPRHERHNYKGPMYESNDSRRRYRTPQCYGTPSQRFIKHYSDALLGFVICNVKLPWPGWIVGLLLGILLSLPDAIITKAVVPILASGAIGGLIIGAIAAKFGS